MVETDVALTTKAPYKPAPAKAGGHGLLQRDGSRYAYRLTPKGVQVALLFLFFYKRLCGPLANSHFHPIKQQRYWRLNRARSRVVARRRSSSSRSRSTIACKPRR